MKKLRRENAKGTLFNIVGFQTNLKFPEQKRVFSMIPALHDAEFCRYGVMHRNTFLHSPGFLNAHFEMINRPQCYFAGQMTGVEGYVESCASGFLAALAMAAKVLEKPMPEFPKTTAIGALTHYVSGGASANFQPMNVNFGIMAPLGKKVCSIFCSN